MKPKGGKMKRKYLLLLSLCMNEKILVHIKEKKMVHDGIKPGIPCFVEAIDTDKRLLHVCQDREHGIPFENIRSVKIDLE